MAYASKYYDPQKAHEYYMRTRELKGSQSTKGMSDNQNETWAVTKDQMGQQKKAELTSTQEAQKVKLEALRLKAETKRDQIGAKLEALVAKMNAKISGVKQQPLHKIPENASPTVRAFLEKQNRNISKKNNEAVSRVRKYASDTIGAARKSNAEERKRISGDLKTALEKAREDYKVARENLVAKYDSDKETEFEKIRTQVS